MALGLVGSFAATAAAQDSGALIDALVRKGVLKDQEAEQIRSQLSRDYAANTPAGKLNISSSVKELKLSGDVRLRYQYDNRDYQTETATANGEQQRTRYRLRLRVNADYKLADDFFAGFGLQTTPNNDSGNQTMGDGNTYQNYNVYINKAFIGWNGIPGVTIIGGKQINPFYTTDLVWDADINPTGITERFDLHKFADLGPLELSLVGGQFVASDNQENGQSNKSNRDAIVYHTQLVAALKLSDDVKVTVAPGYYTSNGANLNGDGTGEANYALWSTTGTEQLRGLKVYTAPGDVSFKVAGKPVKFQWDLAWNADANKRSTLYTTTSSSTSTSTSTATAITTDFYTTTIAPTPGATTAARTVTNLAGTSVVYATGATVTTTTVGGGQVNTITGNKVTTTPTTTTTTNYPTSSDRDTLAYLVGFQIGENKKKGDWSLLANYREVGLSAVDPNINDSDWALSYTNMAGFKVGFFYNLGDATTIGSTFYSASNLRKDLGTNMPSAGPGSGFNAVQVLQVDLSVKF